MYGPPLNHTHTMEAKEALVIIHSTDRIKDDFPAYYSVILHERLIDVSEIHVVAADVPDAVDVSGTPIAFGYLHLEYNEGEKIPTLTVQSGASEDNEHETTAANRNTSETGEAENVLGVVRLGDPSGKCLGGHVLSQPIRELRTLTVRLTDRHGRLLSLPTDGTGENTIVLQVKCRAKRSGFHNTTIAARQRPDSTTPYPVNGSHTVYPPQEIEE